MREMFARGRVVAGRIAIALGFGLAAVQGFADAAQAAGFPDHPGKIVVPFAAGGNIGAELVYKSAPDGYTLLSAPPPPLVNQNLYPNLGFDPTKFEPILVMA